jgi:hypothetical protein
MARPIKPTPVLKGKDARVFLEQTRLDKRVPAERVRWLQKLAKESKVAEK